MIGFCPYKADPDIYIQDDEDHYKHINIYSYEPLVLIKDTTGILRVLNNLLPLKRFG